MSSKRKREPSGVVLNPYSWKREVARLEKRIEILEDRIESLWFAPNMPGFLAVQQEAQNETVDPNSETLECFDKNKRQKTCRVPTFYYKRANLILDKYENELRAEAAQFEDRQGLKFRRFTSRPSFYSDWRVLLESYDHVNHPIYLLTNPMRFYSLLLFFSDNKKRLDASDDVRDFHRLINEFLEKYHRV